MKQLILIIFSIFFSNICAGSNAGTENYGKEQTVATDLEDITVKRERVFTGTGLFGYMNGGAELYLEYGVRKLTTRDLVFMNEEYTLDIYEMPTPEDAFGIYSLHTFKCLQADTDDCINCMSTYQLQMATGNYYVSLVFTSGSEKARINAKVLLQHYLSDIKRDNVFIPEQIQPIVSLPYSGVLKFLRGPISLSSAQLSLANTLKDIEINGVWFFPSDIDNEYRALIIFNDVETSNSIRDKIIPDDIVGYSETWLHIRCRDIKKSDENNDPFGF